MRATANLLAVRSCLTLWLAAMLDLFEYVRPQGFVSELYCWTSQQWHPHVLGGSIHYTTLVTPGMAMA